MSLLDISGISIDYRVGSTILRAVDNISLQVHAGETIGIAGESGCGKSSLGLSVPRLLPQNATIASGQIKIDGEEVTTLSENQLNKLRWTKAAFVFQGAMNALNPVLRISRQILEPIVTHAPETAARDAEQRVMELLDLVGISPSRARSYPHEFSGGMRQRVMIAMALACHPSLLIADEPTTALDVISQAQILSLLGALRKQQNLALVMISHDLAAIRRTCDRILVMYAGVIVESGPTATILGGTDRRADAAHPYTQALISAHPNLRGERVLAKALPGHPPDLSQAMRGCRFHDRCPARMNVCQEIPPQPRKVSNEHVVACHLIGSGEAP